MSVTSSFCFSLSNHLIPGFLESVLKKIEDIISIQFVRSLCEERTDRLSYFGGAPRGALRGLGGGGRGNKRPLPFTPDHYWPFKSQQNQPKVFAREDITELWMDTRRRATPLKRNCSYRHEAVQQARVGFGRRLQPFHRPLLDDGRHLRVFCVEDAEARHVDAAVAVRFHIEGKEVLHDKRSKGL